MRSNKDIVVSVQNLSKSYRIGVSEERTGTVLGAVARFVKKPWTNLRRLRRLGTTERNGAADQIWALDDVSFEVRRGEAMAIIGRNGAGKTTLLKILSRITYPTSGSAEVCGRVSSLLEVGTGFHPELTGRENVFLNGTFLGMSRREVTSKFDEIVDFAGVARFIDTPVKRFSSGMRLRLAFAVAAHLEPEILIIDEVLAVGDYEFQKRCMGKMDEVARQGRTVLFVSHNLAAARQLCESGILLQGGRMVLRDTVDHCIERYLGGVGSDAGKIVDYLAIKDTSFEVLKITVNGQSDSRLRIRGDEALDIRIRFRLTATKRTALQAFLRDSLGEALALFSPGHESGSPLQCEPGEHEILGEIRLPRLNRGSYHMDLLLADPGIEGQVDLPACLHLEVEGVPTKAGIVFDATRGSGFQMLHGSQSLRSASRAK